MKQSAKKRPAAPPPVSRKLDLPAAVVEAYLGEMRVRFEQGDKAVLFAAIRFCGNEELVLPEWVVGGFFAATNRWYSLKCKTLDEAFAVTWPKGLHLNAARKKRRLELAVWMDVKSRHERGDAMNRDLFRAVGKLHGIGKTLAEEYYRSAALKHANVPAPEDILLEPYMTSAAKAAHATRKITKFRGTRSKSR